MATVAVIPSGQPGNGIRFEVLPQAPAKTSISSNKTVLAKSMSDKEYPPRPSWNKYFMDMATLVASRSTCHRKHVGAVIVKDKTVLSTGYNGSIRGLPHCCDVGHMMDNTHCVATVHAEANAIVQAAKNGVALDGAEIYVTASPCWNCFKLIANAGIKKVYYGEFYRDERTLEAASAAKISVLPVSG